MPWHFGTSYNTRLRRHECVAVRCFVRITEGPGNCCSGESLARITREDTKRVVADALSTDGLQPT